MLARLLPPGPMFDTDSAGWVALLLALGAEPARVDDDAEQFLEDFMPDTVDVSGAMLEDWERVLGLDGTAEDRGAAIRAKLLGNGAVDRASLEAVMRAMRGDDTTLRLLHGLYPPFVCDVGACGDGCGDAWAAAWTCEYIANAIVEGSDDFEAWDQTGTVTVANAQAQSPRTESTTAGQVTLAAGAQISVNVPQMPSGSTVRASLWLRAVGTPEPEVSVGLQGRDNTYREIFNGPVNGCWGKIAGSALAGTGGNVVRLQIRATGAGVDLYASWARAGLRDLEFETRAAALAPINTAGEWAVKGEYAGAVEALTLDGDLITLDGEEITVAF